MCVALSSGSLQISQITFAFVSHRSVATAIPTDRNRDDIRGTCTGQLFELFDDVVTEWHILDGVRRSNACERRFDRDGHRQCNGFLLIVVWTGEISETDDRTVGGDLIDEKIRVTVRMKRRRVRVSQRTDSYRYFMMPSKPSCIDRNATMPTISSGLCFGEGSVIVRSV